MSAFVLDASVALEWCFQTNEVQAAERVRRKLERVEAIVPSIWPLEIANVVVLAERRKKILPSDAREFIMLLQCLPIYVDEQPTSHVWSRTMETAREFELTVYDAAYLELAIRRRLPLASFDKRLRSSANAAGVPLVTK